MSQVKPIRHLDLWDFCVWAYRDQKAHYYLDDPEDWFAWAIDQTVHDDALFTRVPVHYDAAMLHAAVMDLGFLRANLIVQHAAAGNRPEISLAVPRAYPVPPDRSYMRSVEVNLLAERASWSTIDGRRVDYLIREREKVVVSELREARVRRSTKRRRMEAVEKTLPVEFCPIDWDPDPAYVDLCNAVYREWVDALLQLYMRLDDVRLRRHQLTGFAYDDPPSYFPPVEPPPRWERPDVEYLRLGEPVSRVVSVEADQIVVENMTRHVSTRHKRLAST